MKTTEFFSEPLRERYFRVEHPSGLPIYVFPKRMTSTYVLFAVNYGSVDNEIPAADGGAPVRVPDGIAHFLEHKLFENEDGSDSFARFSELGADANAYTAYNRTAYLFNCTDRFEESLEELLRFVTHPHFTEASIQREQGIIAEEIRMYEDHPWERGYGNLLRAMYPKNPVRKNICGTVASIRQITPELLYRCYNAYYHLSNMVLVVCGDVPVETVCAVADRILPGEPDRLPPLRREPTEEPATVARHYVEARMPVAKPLFQIGIKDAVIPKDPVLRLRRDTAMTLLDEILFSRSGAFYNSLFEEGVITPSFAFGYSSADSFAFNGLSGESDTPEEVWERLRRYLAEVRQNGISREDFERCRRVLYAEELRSYDSTEEIANRLLSYALDGAEMFSYPEVLQSITREELQALLETAFREDCVALSVIAPLAKDGEAPAK